ncbi:MAG: arsenic resistance N-acetyltransferase ArsN2 [Salinibacter sp.]|uniref:arsenic resistance N-acetyltransferase ArsN2 n=1 Tax=Salinibacter sp. TaxID=2065818 RepID=UPI0035D45875
MDIQSAPPEDLRDIQDLLRAVDLPAEDLTPEHLAHFLVGRDGQRLVGAVGIEPTGDGALLRSLAVRPTHQGEGVGTRLLGAMETQAQHGDVETLYLLTTSAASFFRRHGYATMERSALPTAIQQTEEAARLCPASATCMQKSLGATEETCS